MRGPNIVLCGVRGIRCKIRLSQDNIGWGKIGGRNGVPDEDAAVIGISHKKSFTIGEGSMRISVERRRSYSAIIGSALDEIRLSHNDIGRRKIRGRDRVPDKDAVVTAVNDKKLFSIGEPSKRNVERCRSYSSVVGCTLGEIWLSYNDISFLEILQFCKGWYRSPQPKVHNRMRVNL